MVTAIKNLDNDLINPMEKIYEHASDSQCIDLIAQIAENISFYYTYTIPLSSLRTATTGSHEVMVRYTINQKLGRGILPPIIYNPRNL